MDKPVEKLKLIQYTIEVDAMIPATLKYKVLAYSPEEALLSLQKATLIESPKLNINSMKKISAKIFNYGTSILKLSKRF